MKKRIAFLGIIFSVLLSACTNDIKIADNEVIYSDFVFSLEEVQSFTVDDNDNLYCAITAETDRLKTVEYNGISKEVPIYETTIYAYDKNGKEIKRYIIDRGTSFNNLTFYDNALYYTISTNKGWEQVQALYKYDLETEQEAQLYIFDSFTDIMKMTEINGALYILGIDKALSKREVELFNADDEYYYLGENIVKFDIASGEYSEFYNELPVTFSAVPSGDMIIYSYDENGGYRFVRYEADRDCFELTKYHNLRKIQSIVMVSENEYFYNDHVTYMNIRIGDFNSDDNAEILPNAYFDGSEVFKNGYLYYRSNKDNNSIKRIVTDEYLQNKNMKAINIITTERQLQAPISYGFNVNRKEVEHENFALKVLSNDKDFEICIVNSRRDYSFALREKQVYYPLNDIPGMTEYVNSLFPFIKDAITDKNGNIWAFPIAVNPIFISYNPAICEAEGLSFNENISISEFIDKIISLYNNGEPELAYETMSAVYITENIISQYLSSYDTFDNELFRTLSSLIKNKLFENEDAFSNPKMTYANASGDFSRVAFGFTSGIFDENIYNNTGGFLAAPFPYIEGNDKSVADFIFMCVNPASDNIEPALLYIAQVIKESRADKNNHMLKDSEIFSSSSYYKSVSEIYNNCVIRFALSHEIFINDFYKYIEGDLELEELIATADNKLNTYLYE